LSTSRSALVSTPAADRVRRPNLRRPVFSRSDLKADFPISVNEPRAPVAEESLILDARGELTPAQMVEKKLMSMLRGKGLLASHIQMARLLKGRG
jgi:hypothetical protein